jgi:plasmid stabilization system protein ParE
VRIEFHPEVAKDLAEAARRYDSGSPQLTEQFMEEFRRMVAIVARNPGRFHPAGKGFRRANLRRFPYHFLYRETESVVRIILVKHHRRDP